MQTSPCTRKNKCHRYKRQCASDTVSSSLCACPLRSPSGTHWHCLIKCTSGLTWVFCLMQFAALYVCINLSLSLSLYTLLLMLVLLSTSFLSFSVFLSLWCPSSSWPVCYSFLLILLRRSRNFSVDLFYSALLPCHSLFSPPRLLYIPMTSFLPVSY